MLYYLMTTQERMASIVSSQESSERGFFSPKPQARVPLRSLPRSLRRTRLLVAPNQVEARGIKAMPVGSLYASHVSQCIIHDHVYSPSWTTLAAHRH